MGYEDLNDHDQLRHDPLLGVWVDKADPTGQDRRREGDRGKAVAGKSTLNRLELTPAPEQATAKDKRYKKIGMPAEKIDALFMENRIKEQQLYLFADRTSTGKMRANQLRLYFSAIAYVLMQALRREGLKGTAMAAAQCQTIRVKLLKIGAQIRVTVRNVWVSLSSAYPYAKLFRQVYQNLQTAWPLRG